MGTKLPILAILITGAAAGLLRVPSGDDTDGTFTEVADAGDMGDSRLTSSSSNSNGTGGWGGETTLERDSDGHFYADVTVDGRDYRMLVDTGASVVALTGADAASMGLLWDESDLSVVAQGASGPVEGVHTQIDTLALGDHEARQVAAIIVPEGLTVSLLGQSFLQTLGTVEMSGDAMVIGN